MMNYPVTHHLRVMLSHCHYSGRRGRLFQFDRSALSSRVVEEEGMTEEDEDEEDGIHFATLES